VLTAAGAETPVAAAVAAVPAAGPAKKHGRFMTWLNADQPQAGAQKEARKEAAPAVKPADTAAPVPPPPPVAPQAEEAGGGGGSKPQKKQGRFMTWLNADQPQAQKGKQGGGEDGDASG